MRLSVSDVVALPRAQVFARLSDFDRLMASGGQRGARIERLDSPGPIAVGSAWSAEIRFHGLNRPATAHVAELTAPSGFVLTGRADGVSLHLDLSLEEIACDRTSFRLIAEVQPRSVTGRVLVKTARLMKSTLEARFKDRVHAFLRKIETETG